MTAPTERIMPGQCHRVSARPLSKYVHRKPSDSATTQSHRKKTPFGSREWKNVCSVRGARSVAGHREENRKKAASKVAPRRVPSLSEPRLPEGEQQDRAGAGSSPREHGKLISSRWPNSSLACEPRRIRALDRNGPRKTRATPPCRAYGDRSRCSGSSNPLDCLRKSPE